ncbi:MAG TPA: DUF2142 domain-containing protein [Patescibacteria group bacterium]
MKNWLKGLDWAKISKNFGIIAALFLASFLLAHLVFWNSFNQYRFLFVLAIVLLASFFFVFRKKIGEKPEFGFLAVALICGSLLSFSEPKKYVNWDEQIHYKRAEALAANVVPGMFFRPNTVDSSYSLEEQGKINILTDSQYKRSKSRSKADNLTYQNAAYLPSAFALALGNLLHLPFHIMFAFARWINLLFYSAVVFFAIRRLKTGKMLMSVIALFPTAIFLAASYNYDSWLTAFSMIGFAYLFSELQQPEKKLTTKEAVVMVGSFVLGLGPKALYFPLMLPLFLIKKEKFETPRQYKIFMWLTVVAVLLVLGSFLLPFVFHGPGKGDVRGGSDVDATKQVAFILSDPSAYSKILFNFASGYVNPLNAGGFTVFLAYLGGIDGFWIVMATLAAVFLWDRNTYDKKNSLKMRLLVVGAYIVTVVLICTALYVSFTAVRSTTMAGVQPRYLIPLVFPLLFVLGIKAIKNPFNKNIFNSIVFIAMSLVLLNGTWVLMISKYY